MYSWTTWLLSFLTVGVISFYFYLTRNLNHFKLKGIPFKTPKILFGNVLDRLLAKKSFHEFHRDYYLFFKGNPCYGIFEGSSPVLHITEPDLIRTVLVKDFDYFMDRPMMKFKAGNPYVDKIMLSLTGKEWKQVRSAVTPAFSSGRLKAMIDIENKCGIQFTKYILRKIEGNDGKSVTLDMKETLGKFTLDTIASTAFGVELDTNSDPNSEMASKIAKFNELKTITRFTLLFMLFLQFPRWITSRVPVSFFNNDSVSYLAAVIKDVTSKRKELNSRRNDFLQLLIDAQSTSIQEESANSPAPDIKTEKGVPLSEEVAIAQAILFFIAGYETSATTLTMLSYELAKNPHIQDKLRKEVMNKLKETSGEVTYEVINELPYLDMTIAETLRMYPPVARIDRLCVKKYTLDTIEINPGEKIAVPIYPIQNDPEYFPEPDVFRPERFSTGEKEKRHQFVYLPFGAGPRNCIGMRAAQMSMKICLIHLIRELKLETCTETKIPFEFHKASMLLKAKDGVLLQISKL